MIGIDDIREVMRIKGIKNLGFGEKDYFQELLLLAISRERPDLVFKGGTSLYKLHGLDRFSEDIDLVGEMKIHDLDAFSQYITRYGYQNESDHREMESGLLSTFKVQGFLFNGDPLTLTRIQVDASVKDPTVLEPVHMTLHSLYPDIPSIRLLCMNPSEIMAEKVRALFMREKAKDLYDLDFLLSRGTSIDMDLIDHKLGRYGLVFSKEILQNKVNNVRRRWKNEMAPLTDHLPDIKSVSNVVINGLTAKR